MSEFLTPEQRARGFLTPEQEHALQGYFPGWTFDQIWAAYQRKEGDAVQALEAVGFLSEDEELKELKGDPHTGERNAAWVYLNDGRLAHVPLEYAEKLAEYDGFSVATGSVQDGLIFVEGVDAGLALRIARIVRDELEVESNYAIWDFNLLPLDWKKKLKASFVSQFNDKEVTLQEYDFRKGSARDTSQDTYYCKGGDGRSYLVFSNREVWEELGGNDVFAGYLTVDPDDPEVRGYDVTAHRIEDSLWKLGDFSPDAGKRAVFENKGTGAFVEVIANGSGGVEAWRLYDKNASEDTGWENRDRITLEQLIADGTYTQVPYPNEEHPTLRSNSKSAAMGGPGGQVNRIQPDVIRPKMVQPNVQQVNRTEWDPRKGSEDEKASIPCPACGNKLGNTYLGHLDNVIHLKCTNCGVDYHKPLKSSAQVDSGVYQKLLHSMHEAGLSEREIQEALDRWDLHPANAHDERIDDETDFPRETKLADDESYWGYSDSKGALQCPHCGSHTVQALELNKGRDSEFHCHNCKKRFKHRVYVEKSSAILDTFGKPIRAGDMYLLHSTHYKVPDIVKVLKVEANKVKVRTNHDIEAEFPISVTGSELEEKGFSFEPFDASDYALTASFIESLDVEPQGMSRLAKSSLSVQEQRDLINENPKGRARNLGKLNLDGTHYSWNYEEDPDDPLSAAFLV